MLKSPILILIACIVYFGFLLRNVSRKKTFMEHFIFTSFYFYIVGVLIVTLFPIPVDQAVVADYLSDGWQPKHNFIPFHSVYRLTSEPFFGPMRQVLGNILLLLPLGFYAPLMNSATKFRHVVLIGIASSAAIELTQLLLGAIIGYNYRLFDVDDIIANTLGCTIGYVIFGMVIPGLTKYADIKITGAANTNK